MTIQKQAGFWLAAFVATAFFLWLFSDILLPFVAALALAYLLDPVADRLERLGLGRLAATLLILLAFVLVLVLVLVLILPLVARETTAFLESLPGYVARLQSLLVERGAPLLDYLGVEISGEELQRNIGDIVSRGAGYLGTVLGTLLASGQTVISVFSLLVLTPIIAFYLLVDWDRMVATVDGWLPLRNRATIRRLAGEIDSVLSRFVRGQATLCLILGGFYALALMAIGLNFGALIGLVAGLLSVIPYVGSITGLLLSVGVAIVQFWPDWIWIVATLSIFLFGQFVEGNFLSPKLLGGAVGIHPVWLMFALFAFGSLFGFVGLLLAVPLAAMVGVLTRFALGRYLESPFYDPAIGRGPQRPAEDRDG
ncbi:AI-2E family transporter [Salinarimonas sp. NSM]|uniref:AI-2E family transporter n=1 Tax=Salinarimonas sp. NSM TaxID=3458003 RepID=UPI004036C35B